MTMELDPKLKSLYESMPKDQPSPDVDARILQAAARPASGPRGRDWLLPFGAVASVVVISTLVVHWQSREPETWKEAVTAQPVTVALPSPVVAEPAATSVPPVEAAAPVDPLAEEKAMAARRSAELARLRAEVARQDEADAPVPPPALPTVRLKPEAPPGESRQLLPAEASSERQARAEALVADGGAGERFKSAMAPRAAIASVLLEGVSLGMHREDLAALGWECRQTVCARQIDDPRQPAYWNMPVLGATQRVMFTQEAVTAMTLSQVNVALNNVKLALERVGKPSERTCPLGAGEQLVSRQAGAMILTLWQDGELTTLGVCQGK